MLDHSIYSQIPSLTFDVADVDVVWWGHGCKMLRWVRVWLHQHSEGSSYLCQGISTKDTDSQTQKEGHYSPSHGMANISLLGWLKIWDVRRRINRLGEQDNFSWFFTVGFCVLFVCFIQPASPKTHIQKTCFFYLPRRMETLSDSWMTWGRQLEFKMTLKHFLKRHLTSFNVSFHFIIPFTRSCHVSVTQTADVFFNTYIFSDTNSLLRISLLLCPLC